MLDYSKTHKWNRMNINIICSFIQHPNNRRSIGLNPIEDR